MTELPQCSFRSEDAGELWCSSPRISPADEDKMVSPAMCLGCHPNLRKPVDANGHAPVAAAEAVAPEPKYLGDHVAAALKVVGVTPERVSAWLGEECNCPERQSRWNAIDKWAREGIAAGASTAKRWLTGLLGDKTLTPVPPSPPASPPQFPIRFDEHNLAVGLSGKRFNASIIEWGDGYALAWRSGWAGSEVWISLLDKDFRSIRGKHFKLELTRDGCAYGREDPRLFMFAGQLHVMYIGVEVQPSRRVRRRRIRTNVLYARLDDDLKVEKTFYPDYTQRNVWEKNWGFFGHAGQLYAVYSIAPHRILRIDGEAAALIHTTPTVSPWTWGEPRGGAAPVRFRDEWYVWFHGRKLVGPKLRYATGVYTFSAEPPFRVLRMTPEPLIEADPTTNVENNYADVEFCCGAVRCEGDWIISSGVHDRWSELRRFSAEEIERRLVPV